MKRPLHWCMTWWPWPWFKVTGWPWTCWKMDFCSFSDTIYCIALKPLPYCSKWQGLYMGVYHDDLDLDSRSVDDLECAEKLTFAHFLDTIYSIILKPLPSCSKPKDLYRDVWQDDLDLGSRSLGDLQILPYMDIWDVSPCWLCHSC